MIYSHSRLATFEQCPYKYKLRYLQHIDPIIKDTVEAFLGSIVHETLEKLYNDLQYEKRNNLDDLLTFLHYTWYEKWNDEILIVKDQYTMKNYLSLAKRFVTDYYETYKPFNSEQTIALEDRVIITLDEDKNYQMKGYVDRLAEGHTGYYQIHDYKTSSWLPSQKQLDENRQLPIYALGVKEKYPDVKDITLIWHFLKFNKEMRLKASIEQLDTLKDRLISLIKTIENTTIFSRKPSSLCTWCEYRPICPQYSHLYQIREKNENRYIKKTGKQLVDRYAELEKQKKQMKLDMYAESDHIKEALIKYATRENLDVIYGTDSKVLLHQSSRFVIPEKGTTEWEKLKELLKRNQKWDEITSLDTSALSKILKENQWDEALIEQLKIYVKLETRKQLYFTKKQEK
ncbi:MAG: PD-(D/E)XK nuclease family protein [Candidatus Thermoplasmatota archaeon]|nr:PD-(D/E)XK nuclease family protein [Candidatus Thermoplasmatota archaeon]